MEKSKINRFAIVTIIVIFAGISCDEASEEEYASDADGGVNNNEATSDTRREDDDGDRSCESQHDCSSRVVNYEECVDGKCKRTCYRDDDCTDEYTVNNEVLCVHRSDDDKDYGYCNQCRIGVGDCPQDFICIDGDCLSEAENKNETENLQCEDVAGKIEGSWIEEENEFNENDIMLLDVFVDFVDNLCRTEIKISDNRDTFKENHQKNIYFFGTELPLERVYIYSDNGKEYIESLDFTRRDGNIEIVSEVFFGLEPAIFIPKE